MTEASRFPIHRHDILIVGGGCAALRAALEAADGADVAVICKVLPAWSRTGAAPAGAAAALGNVGEDSFLSHMSDTVRGSDYLGDQDAIETLCREAPRAIYELEHMGVPFSRLDDGRISQRLFGGHGAARVCHVADRTGHAIQQTLYEQCLGKGLRFYGEFFVASLIRDEGGVQGLVAWDILRGGVHVFFGRAVLLASGGCGRVYKTTSNGLTSTGDGMALAYDAGVPLEDMEFIQFHPTGMYKKGIAVSDGAFVEGGLLLNGMGERFMEAYAPVLKEMAPRDVVSRAIHSEIGKKRGVEGKDYVYLDLRHLGRKKIMGAFPDLQDLARTYLGVDPVKAMIPVQPTCHSAMGGIPTDMEGRVLVDDQGTALPGLYAAGECACLSLHGANRLGCNGLIDSVVFGRRTGRRMLDDIRGLEMADPSLSAAEAVHFRIEDLLEGAGQETAPAIRERLQEMMTVRCSVFRNERLLEEAQKDLMRLRARYAAVQIMDRGRTCNTDLVEALELGHLITVADTVVAGALARTESRGGHFREDFPDRNDRDFLKHSLVRKSAEGPVIAYKPVRVTRYEPEERTP